MKKKNSLLTLILSCCPGGGHMYLGFMKQGVQLMTLFFGTIAIASSYIFRSISFLIPILVAYSIFDASNKRSNMVEPDDSDLDLFKWFNIRNTGSLKEINYYKTGAYILVVLGVYMLFDNVVIGLMRKLFVHWFDRMHINFYAIERAVKSSILGIIFILGGIKLLGQLKKSNTVDQDDENV